MKHLHPTFIFKKFAIRKEKEEKKILLLKMNVKEFFTTTWTAFG